MEDITLEKIKSDVEMMVNNSCDIMVKNSKGLFNNFSFEKNKEFMVNAIIFEYLIRWLDNDNNAAQTINNFAKSKYIYDVSFHFFGTHLEFLQKQGKG